MTFDTSPGGEIDDREDGLLIKVLDIAEDGSAFFGRLANGNTARFTLAESADVVRGDIVFVTESSWRLAPQAAWADDSGVGVVRRLLDDGVLIETSGGGMRVLSGATRFSVDVGNTVQYTEIDGITRVLSATPLRYRDTGLDEDLSEFIVKSGATKLTFDSFGGYEGVKARARELIETQLDRAYELRKIGARSVKGVILTGAPGTGKTHLARIIADVADATFYLVSGPSIVSKWVGDSEEALRRLFEDASKQKRAIIFFDEIDSIAARRTADSNGESKRVVAQLLTLLDGFEADSNVIVIAATNRVEDIDDALLRPGRFDWEIQFELPTEYDRAEILRLKAAELETEEALPLEGLTIATAGWSGAMLTALWTEAALLAAGDRRVRIADEDLAIAFERVRSRPVHVRSEADHAA